MGPLQKSSLAGAPLTNPDCPGKARLSFDRSHHYRFNCSWKYLMEFTNLISNGDRSSVEKENGLPPDYSVAIPNYLILAVALYAHTYSITLV